MTYHLSHYWLGGTSPLARPPKPIYRKNFTLTGLSLDALHDIENQAENIQKLTKAANEIKDVVLLSRKKEIYKYGNRSYDSLGDLLQSVRIGVEKIFL